MERLPNELLDAIFAKLALLEPVPYNLRLVSRSWSHLLWPYLSVNNWFSNDQHDLERFVSVSKHPLISRQIVHLIWYDNPMDKDGDSDYHASLASLGSLLKHFVKLDSITVQAHMAMLEDFESESQPKNIIDIVPSILQGLLDRQRFDTPQEIVPILSLIILNCNKSLWDLSLPVIQSFEAFLCHLTVLILECAPGSNSLLSGNGFETQDIPICTSKWHLLLKQSRSLQKLRLILGSTSKGSMEADEEGHWIDFPTTVPDSVSDILGDIHWQDLRELELRSCLISRAQFESFLIRHKLALRQLSIEDCTIESDIDEAWINCFKFLKDNMNLEKFRVGGDLESTHEDDPRIWSDTCIDNFELVDESARKPELPLDQVIEYLVCGKRIEGSACDPGLNSNVKWEKFTWDCIEEGYMSS